MNVFKVIADLVSKNGLSFVIVLLFLSFVAGGGVLAYKWLDKKIANIKFNNIIYSQEDLYNHTVFQTIRRNVSYDIGNLSIGERLREAIFRDFLIFKFTAVRNELQNFLAQGSLDKLDNNTYKTKLLESIDRIIQNYSARALAEGIPQIVISKFNDWNAPRIEMLYDFLNDICDSEDLFDSNIIRTKIVFDFFVHFLNLVIVDARKTLISLNGQLNSVIYKGIESERK